MLHLYLPTRLPARQGTVNDPRRQIARLQVRLPSELKHRIEATCRKCGQHTLSIYPAGASCSTCSPEGLKDVFTRELERRRVTLGAVPEPER